MFNQDFYPTPEDVIIQMLEGTEIENKIVLEPSAGKGNIIDYLNLNGAKNVLFCETEKDLQTISSQKAKFLKADFLQVTSAEISHVNLIVMNPPFTADEKHILHAYNIAPAGCKVISLCNYNTIKNSYSRTRIELETLIKNYGSSKNLGECFKTSERSTSVEIGLIILQKPTSDYETEFNGFFMEEEENDNPPGLMSYNVIQDLVGRYVDSVKIFDKQLEEAQRMNELTKGYFSVSMGMNITEDKKPIQRNEFKKAMQKSGWNFIFAKMNMKKYATRGLKEDINKFVEEQEKIPFTMRNIYKMLEIIVGTNEQRMDKAILEVFDTLTTHYHENRYNVEGWKTNSHYMLNEKFIIPSMVEKGYRGEVSRCTWSSGNFEKMEDLIKAICYITGDNYSNFISLENFISYKYKLVDENGNFINDKSYDFDVKIMSREYNYMSRQQSEYPGSQIESNDIEWGQWLDWGYFEFKCFKKGTIHFKFKDRELWARFNQRVAKLKGYPLFEKAPDKRTERQKARDEAKGQEAKKQGPKVKPTILGTFKVAV